MARLSAGMFVVFSGEIGRASTSGEADVASPRAPSTLRAPWKALFVLLLFCTVLPGWAQTDAGDSQVTSGGAVAPGDDQPEDQRPISWKLIVPNIVHDQVPIWTFPGKLAKREHLTPTLAVVAATAGLVALDSVDAPYFRRTTTFNQFNKVFSGTNMGVGMAVVPLSFYAISLVRKKTYGQHTALLAGEAVVDAEILATVMKNVDRRLRPSALPPNGDFDDTWFRAHASLTGSQASFPSGHTIAAFAVAAVFADRYRDHRWAPWVAYGLAGLVGFSRVTLSAHFPSDVFAGAALGYVISHYVVDRNH